MVKKKKKKERSFLLSLFVIFLLLLALVAVVYNDFNRVVVSKREIKELKKKYELLKEEEAALNVEVAKMQDFDYIARYAREKYMFSKDGEIILRIVDPDEKDKNKDSEEE